MFYRYEARTGNGQWHGIFQAFDPSDRRKWHCLTVPKWYSEHFLDKILQSRAWFTDYGYAKWHEKMEKTIEESTLKARGYETRLITADTLDNIVMKGKTQVIQKI